MRYCVLHLLHSMPLLMTDSLHGRHSGEEGMHISHWLSAPHAMTHEKPRKSIAPTLAKKACTLHSALLHPVSGLMTNKRHAHDLTLVKKAGTFHTGLPHHMYRFHTNNETKDAHNPHLGEEGMRVRT